LAAEQALGERVVLLGEIVAAGGGFGEADLGRTVVEPDLFGQRLGVELVAATGMIGFVGWEGLVDSS
jgi:hypothetical protein